MTRKDYEAIAAIINREQAKRGEQPPARTAYDIARSLAYYMAEDNPRFNVARFQAACGMIDCKPFIAPM